MTNFSPLPDDPQNGEISYFSTFCNLPISASLSFSPLTFNVITSSTQNDIGEGHITTDVGVPQGNKDKPHVFAN
jgi:hypothetical protein